VPSIDSRKSSQSLRPLSGMSCRRVVAFFFGFAGKAASFFAGRAPCCLCPSEFVECGLVAIDRE